MFKVNEVAIEIKKEKEMSRKGRIVYKVMADGEFVGHVVSRKHIEEYWYRRGRRYDTRFNEPPNNTRFWIVPPEQSPLEDKQMYYSPTLRSAARVLWSDAERAKLT